MKVTRFCTKCNHKFVLEVKHENKTCICPICYGPIKN